MQCGVSLARLRVVVEVKVDAGQGQSGFGVAAQCPLGQGHEFEAVGVDRLYELGGWGSCDGMWHCDSCFSGGLGLSIAVKAITMAKEATWVSVNIFFIEVCSVGKCNLERIG